MFTSYVTKLLSNYLKNYLVHDGLNINTCHMIQSHCTVYEIRKNTNIIILDLVL